MQEIHIGEIIKQRRRELALTQEELCFGLCTTATLSRIENGTQTPGRSLLDALLQRLGMPGKKYYAMMGDNEIEIESFKKKIVAENVKRNYSVVYDLLDEFEALLEENDHINRQFILRVRAYCGYRQDGVMVPYSNEEQLQLCFEAIRLTHPQFEMSTIGKYLYSMDEVKILNYIAMIYGRLKKFDVVFEIYEQLMKYVMEKSKTLGDSIVMIPLVAYNYARLLGINGRYEDTIRIAEIGRKECITYGRMEKLPGLLHCLAEAYHNLGDTEQARKLYTQSYYTYLAKEDYINAEILQKDAMESMCLKLEP